MKNENWTKGLAMLKAKKCRLICGKKSQIRNGSAVLTDFDPSNLTPTTPLRALDFDGSKLTRKSDGSTAKSDGSRRVAALVASGVLASALAGCLTPTRAIVTEYDQHGNAVRTVETFESVVRSLTRSTAGKTVIAWKSGWSAYIKATTATIENPVPSVKIFAGNVNCGIITTPPGAGDWQGIARAIEATKAPLQVTGTGVRGE